MAPDWTGRPAVKWVILLAISTPVIVAMESLRLPAAFLLGPMFVAIALAANEVTLQLNRVAIALAQGTIGTMMAHNLPFSTFGEILRDWPLFLSLVFVVIVLSFGIGWILAMRQILPGTTAIWGSSPGAASAMILMAESSDADVRLVAFMQFLRVLMVATFASVITRFSLGLNVAPQSQPGWFEMGSPAEMAKTFGIIASGYLIARLFKAPAVNMLLPMALGIVLQAIGAVEITLPPWLLAAAYIYFGWSVGFRFSRDIIVHAFRALPILFLSTLTLILTCGVIAMLVSRYAGIDPLTAYLATSPGGADSVAIIAASSPVDKPFVMAMQTGRFLIVLFLGPAISRLVAYQFSKRAIHTGAAE